MSLSLNFFLKPRVIIPIVLAVPCAILAYFFDYQILEFFQFLHNPIFDKLADWIVESELMFFVLVIVSSVFMIEMRKSLWIVPLVSTFVTSFALSYVLKAIIMRPRPFGGEGFLGFLDTSMPSSHAMVAFACAAVLQDEYQRVSWFFYLFAIGTSLARVYLEKHFMSDVIVGALFGYLVGIIMLYIVERFVFKGSNY